MADKRDSEDVTIPPKAPSTKHHPSRSLRARKNGFGIGGGYERTYRQKEGGRSDNKTGLYGAISDGGHFASGNADQRFAIGQAGFSEEQSLFKSQFGEQTSGYKAKK